MGGKVNISRRADNRAQGFDNRCQIFRQGIRTAGLRQRLTRIFRSAMATRVERKNPHAGRNLLEPRQVTASGKPVCVPPEQHGTIRDIRMECVEAQARTRACLYPLATGSGFRNRRWYQRVTA